MSSSENIWGHAAAKKLRRQEDHSMSRSVNKVILLGNVGRDPEIASTNGGTLVAKLSLATSERFKDKQGEWQERTEWHNLVAYARGAEILRDYVKKGSKLLVEGKLTTRSWNDKQSGKKMYRTEVVVGNVSLIPGSNGSRPSRSKVNETTPQDPDSDQAEDDFDGLSFSDPDLPV
jgi:single-strand DNA-binding protein